MAKNLRRNIAAPKGNKIQAPAFNSAQIELLADLLNDSEDRVLRKVMEIVGKLWRAN